MMEWRVSGELLVMVILGGAGRPEGAVAGALGVVAAEEAAGGAVRALAADLRPAGHSAGALAVARRGVRLSRGSGAARVCGAHSARLQVTRDVSLTVGAGELHALIGPNGAGKTSLLAQIAGTLRPDAGAVLLEGGDVTRLAPHLRARRRPRAHVSGVRARPRPVGARERRAGGAGRGRPGRCTCWRARIPTSGWTRPARAALAEVGLARCDTPARAHSHGERRAVEIACALAAAPRCLLLDEPLAGLGPAEAAAIVALLARLKGRLAMLLVEHDMDAVFALADRVSVLVEGRIVATGSPAAVRADPVGAGRLSRDACARRRHGRGCGR